jgi:DNA-binding CsgD family transcriptional regulator
VLVGPPGAGTTRLARVAVDAAAAEGAAARWVMATRSASKIALGAMAQLLPDGQPVAGPQLLAELAHRLVEGAGGRRLVIGINDAHMLDPMSASLVHHLAVTRSAFLVLTARTDVSVPDPVFALWKEDLVERLDVHEFDGTETAELVAEALGGQVDGATVHQLWELSRGNATYLRELVESGLGSGALTRVDGIWRWSGRMTPARRLRDLVGARIGALLPKEQEALELLAFGGTLDGDLLLRRIDADTLENLEHRGLLISCRRGENVDVRLAHPLYAEVLRRRTSALRERAVFQRLAESFDGPGGSAADRVRTASWRLAGGLPTDVEVLIDAAEQAMTAPEPDHSAAARVAAAAVKRGGGFAASIVLAQSLMGLGRPDEAEDVLAGLTSEADTDDRRALLAVTRLGNLYWGTGQPDLAADLMREAQAALWTDPQRPELMTMRASLLMYDGQFTTALTTITPLIADPGRLGAMTVSAYAIAADAFCGTGSHDAAIATADEALRAAYEIGGMAADWAVVQLESVKCGALSSAGRFAEAAELAAAGYRGAIAADRPIAQALYGGWHGIVLVQQGKIRSGLGLLRDATGAMPAGSFPFLPVLFAQTAEASALLGDTTAAANALTQAEQALASGSEACASWVTLAGAWLAVLGGRTADGADLAAVAADRARRNGQVQPELVALHTCVRLGAADRVLDRITTVAAGVDGPLAPVLAEHARALVDADAAGLDAVAERFAALGAILMAAEAAAQAARHYAQLGRSGAATMSATRARRWSEDCEGARTPALALLEAASELTPREREIAALAASGMASRAIAERLVVSVRTVDNVLHSVYQKLGVAGRRDLPSVVGVAAGS